MGFGIAFGIVLFSNLVVPLGFEPKITESESVVLPITPRDNGQERLPSVKLGVDLQNVK